MTLFPKICSYLLVIAMVEGFCVSSFSSLWRQKIVTESFSMQSKKICGARYKELTSRRRQSGLAINSSSDSRSKIFSPASCDAVAFSPEAFLDHPCEISTNWKRTDQKKRRKQPIHEESSKLVKKRRNTLTSIHNANHFKKNTIVDGTEQDTTIFVGNMGYDITRQDIEHFFGHCAKNIKSISLPMNSKNGHNRGFAFVRFRTQKAQDDAVQTYHGKYLAGRRIRVSKAFEKKVKPDVNRGHQRAKLTKLYVGNIPPSMSKNELFMIFQRHGADVKDIIFPKRIMDYSFSNGKKPPYAFVMMKEADIDVTVRSMNGYQVPNGLSRNRLVVSRAFDCTTFFVGGLSYWTTVETIKDAFKKYAGEPDSVKVSTRGDFDYCRGTALVTMGKKDAYHAMRKVHGTKIDNCIVRIDRYVPSSSRHQQPRNTILPTDSITKSHDRSFPSKQDGSGRKKSGLMPIVILDRWMRYLKIRIFKNMHH